jgi:hypothetical protein
VDRRKIIGNSGMSMLVTRAELSSANFPRQQVRGSGSSHDSPLEGSGFEPSVPQARDGSVPDSTSRRLRAILDMMQRLDLTDNERAIPITALRRLVDFDPQTLSPRR